MPGPGNKSSKKAASISPQRGRPPKFDYLSYEFLSAVEDMARQGLDDLNIAIGLKEKFGIGLSSVWFSTLKNQKDKNGNPTKIAAGINEALVRGRAVTNQAIKSTALQLLLGQKTVKSTRFNRDGEVICTDEQEIPPDIHALMKWMFDHDPEYRAEVLNARREQISVEASASAPVADDEVKEISVSVTYNQKEDLELQDKFKKPSQ